MYRLFLTTTRAIRPTTEMINTMVLPSLRSTSRFFSISPGNADSGNSEKLLMTSECAKQIVKIASKRKMNLGDIHLRIAVQSGGCSGMQYKFSMDYDKIYDYDSEFVDPSGAKLVVDVASLPYVKGSIVDFEDSLIHTGFVVSKNPNAAASCSCGTSFTAKTSNPYE